MKKTNKDIIKVEFNRIKSMEFVKSTRPNNKDGGIGNTFEDFLGVQENNLNKADYLDYEIKCKRDDKVKSSNITLFSKSPTFPRKANAILLQKFGEVRDLNFPSNKKLNASISGSDYSIVYNKYKMKLEIDRDNFQLHLTILGLENNLIDTVTWSFEDLKKASSKMHKLLFVLAKEHKIDKVPYFHFYKAEIYEQFSFEKFICNIEKGNIIIDLRIGTYNSGPNKGKIHDHGTAFRMKYDSLSSIYDSIESI